LLTGLNNDPEPHKKTIEQIKKEAEIKKVMMQEIKDTIRKDPDTAYDLYTKMQPRIDSDPRLKQPKEKIINEIKNELFQIGPIRRLIYEGI